MPSSRLRLPSAPRTNALTTFSGWLSLPQLITWGSVFYTFSLLIAPLETELGMTRAESSLAFSLALLAEGAATWFVGRWIDQGHERTVMTVGSLWLGVGLLAHSWVSSLWSFYAVWIWLGLGMSATLYTTAFAVVTRRFPNDFRRAIITLTFLGGLASTVFIPLSSWWINLWGWRHALWALAAIQLLLCAPLHALLLRGAAPAVHHADLATVPEVSVRQHLRSPFWLLAIFTVLMMAVTSALPAHMINLLQEAGLPAVWVVSIPAAIGIIQVVGRLLLFVFERYWNVHTANRWIPSLIPLGLLALVLGDLQPAAALVFVLLFGLGNGMNTIVKGTAMAQYVSRTHVGSLNGLLGLPTALSRAAAPWVLGLLWSPTQGYRLGLWWLIAASLGAVIALWLAQMRARLHA